MAFRTIPNLLLVCGFVGALSAPGQAQLYQSCPADGCGVPPLHPQEDQMLEQRRQNGFEQMQQFRQQLQDETRAPDFSNLNHQNGRE